MSSGCDNCYALTMARRLKAMGSAKYQRDGDSRTSGPGFGLTMHPDVLGKPLRWRKPRKVFVNSTSDLFHADVTDEFIARWWVVMALTPQHTYQILTKRHGRMRSLLRSRKWPDVLLPAALRWALDELPGPISADRVDAASEWVERRNQAAEPQPPLPNAWLGTSIEDQATANLRLGALLDTPAHLHFVSCEPLLGEVDLQAADPDAFVDGGISWLIVGGESGRGARPMNVQWARSLVEQGHRHPAGSVFVKQMGSVWARDMFVAGRSVSAHGDTKGGDPQWWPVDLRVREFPAVSS